MGGGAQSFMAGGSDPISEDRIPKNITITSSTFGKNLKWYEMGAQIKCAFELKNAINVFVGDSDFQFAGIAQGQGAYLIVLTPRNQNGRAPYSLVKDVLIQACTGSHAAGIASFLGTDDFNESLMLENVTIRDFSATDITRSGIWKGAGRLFNFDRGPKDIHLESIDVEGSNLSSHFYFDHEPPTGLIARNLKLPPAKYPFFVDNMTPGLASVLKYAPDAIIEI
jgi:hypothetical protein